jgi:4-hydroxybenzoate polyprenyltransferase
MIYASKHSLFTYRSLLVLVVSSLYLAHGYSLNESFDTIIKYNNSKEAFLKSKKKSFKNALIFSYLTFVANLLIALLSSINIILFIIIGAVLAYLYSVPPMRLKEKPFIELICNSLGFSILFLIGYCSIKEPNINALIMTGLYFILFIPLQLIHHIDHFDKDRMEKVNTTVVKYGITISIKFINISLLILILWSLFLWLRGISFLLFLISVLFALSTMFYLYKQINKKGILNTLKLKRNIRFLTIIYVIGILLILF